VRYSAFISYNHKDRGWAEWLHRELERYRLPVALVGRESPLGILERRLPPVFQDREELAASTNLADSVREALAESASLIVICSRNGAASRWVNEEVRTFAGLGRADRIQCLLVPESGDKLEVPHPEAELLPPALLELGSEPLAADARKTGDGKRNSFLKLVAGVVGVRYDELRQREHARRQKRLLTLAAAASIGFIAMTGLAAFALVSRAQAVHERDVARQKTVTAQRTTDFVKGLFEVADPQEAQGQQINVVDALDRGARQLQGELDNEPNVKAELMSTLSDVYMGLGSFRRADDLIRQSLSLRVTDGETRARQMATLAASRALQGDYERAAKLYGQIDASLPDPAKLNDPTLRSRVLIGQAESLSKLDRYNEARPLIRQALAWDEAHSGKDSVAVARDLEALAWTNQMDGQFDASNKDYQTAMQIRVATQGRLHPRVSEDLNQLGANAYFQDRPDAAVHYWRQNLALDERVIGPNHPDLALTLNNLARVMLEQRKFRDAIPLLTRSENIFLAQKGDTHDDFAFIFSNLALAKRGVGDDAEAEALFRRALTAAQVHDHRLIAPIKTDLADLLCGKGRYPEAMALLDQADPLMRKRYPDDPWRAAWVVNTRGACMLAQGNQAGRALVKDSAPVILERWKPATLYGSVVTKRLRAASR
jgi:tetratricopeptide (TPR) repeat protein